MIKPLLNLCFKAVGKNKTWKKRKGGAISSSHDVKAFEKIIKWGREEGSLKNWERKRFKNKNVIGKNIKFNGTLYTPESETITICTLCSAQCSRRNHRRNAERRMRTKKYFLFMNKLKKGKFFFTTNIQSQILRIEK